MKSIVKTMTTIAIVFSVLAILVGVSLIAYPVASILVYGIMFGIYLLVEGIMLVVMSIRSRRLHTPFDGLFKGILSIILGIMLLENANAEWMAAYFGIIIGIDIILIIAYEYFGIPGLNIADDLFVYLGSCIAILLAKCLAIAADHLFTLSGAQIQEAVVLNAVGV